MSQLVPPKFLCSGWARQSGGVDGFLSQNVAGCKAAFVAASGTWVVTFETPILDFNSLDIQFTPDFSSLSNGGGITKSPVLAAPSNLTATGFIINFFGNDGSAITNANAGCFFTVNTRVAR